MTYGTFGSKIIVHAEAYKRRAGGEGMMTTYNRREDTLHDTRL
jgi:hypothetical protein